MKMTRVAFPKSVPIHLKKCSDTFQVALDVLLTIVRSSTVPLSEDLVQSGFPAAARCTLQTDDNATMQVSILCLNSFFEQWICQSLSFGLVHS